MSLKDARAFFDRLRNGLLGPSLSESEVVGLNALLDACRGWPMAWAAYGLATAYHETAGTLRPIRERGTDSYFHRHYDRHGARPHVAERLGNTVAGDGVRYCGRGYVQLTGRRNYALAGARLGVPLIDEPNRAQDPTVAAKILREGMANGWFSGRKLSDFLPETGRGTLAQFKAARRIINGTDRDVSIAGQAMQFQDALEAGGWT